MEFFSSLHEVQSLYILGDLFEYWVGDDAGIRMHQKVVDALAKLSAAGCAITVMLGNRDFLLGNEFAVASGIRLVTDDELPIILHGKPVLLMHGDTLCADDNDYQVFRTQVRDPRWQTEFLARSIDERIAYANHLREQSQKLSTGKTVELMDVCREQVQARMRANQCSTLIHGHTHRPADHLDSTTGTRRLVVGDWHDTHAQIVSSRNAEGLALETWCSAQQT